LRIGRLDAPTQRLAIPPGPPSRRVLAFAANAPWVGT